MATKSKVNKTKLLEERVASLERTLYALLVAADNQSFVIQRIVDKHDWNDAIRTEMKEWQLARSKAANKDNVSDTK